jgi:Ca2+-binding RTX toxin-like protein
VGGERELARLAAKGRDMAIGDSRRRPRLGNQAGGPGDDTLLGDASPDTLSGLDGNDILNGDGGDDSLFGGDGDDYLIGGTGIDVMDGGTGNDTYYVDDAGDVVSEAPGEGADRVAASVSYALAAGAEIELLEAVTPSATDAMNLIGNGIANVVSGNNGANLLDGKGGNDLLAGYGGADIFAFTTALGAGNVDRIADFAFGTDRILLDGAVFAGLAPGPLAAGAFVIGSQAGDADDRIVYDPATGQLFFDADGNGAAAQVQFATLDGHPTLTASDFVATPGSQLNQPPVNKVPGAQTIKEDATLTFAGATAISVNDSDLGAGKLTVTIGVVNGRLTLSGTAGLAFADGDGTDDATMTFSGTQAAINAALAGLLYRTSLDFNGSDKLTIVTNDNGNSGSDPGTSGGPNDEEDIDSVAVTIAAVADIADDIVGVAPNSGTNALDLLANDTFENGGRFIGAVLQGAHGSVAIDGNGTPGDLTDDFVTYLPDAGYSGPDSFTYTVISGGVTETATVTVNVGAPDAPSVAQDDDLATDEATPITGSLFADHGHGADTDPDSPLTIATVNGMAANVGMQFSLPSGALLTVNPDGTFVYDPNGFFDPTPDPTSGAINQPASDAFTYALAGGSEATVTITIAGVDTDDTLLGTAGNDTLNGGTGVDTMSGFAGDDTYYVDDGGDVVIEAAGEGYDRIATIASYALAADASIEILEATNSTSSNAIDLTGNGFGNIIAANQGVNTISGGGGNDILAAYAGADTLNGGDGNDVLIGGAGADLMSGGAGNDIYYVDDGGDVVDETADGDSDRVAASVSYFLTAGAKVELLEAITPSATNAIHLAGNEFGNVIVGNEGVNILQGLAGDDLLSGLGGADVLIGGVGDDVLVGGVGNDLMTGGAGNDTYIVEDGADVVSEAAGEGFDRIAAAVSYTLPLGSAIEQLEAVTMAATDAFDFAGNELGNVLIGNAGANRLDGGFGNDVLIGLGGADIFAFTTPFGPGNVDLIQDFAAGIDRIALDDALFAGLMPGALAIGAFVTGAQAGDADDRIVYNSATGQLFFDADGNGAGAAVLFATLDGHPTLSAGDFVVI